MTLEQEVAHYKNMVRLYKFDYLTGMKQRQDFEHETNTKLVSQEFHLVMYDIIGLHAINREKGYAAGDALVTQVANDIKMQDGLWECYRIGGDEFMAVYFDKPGLGACVQNATVASVFSGDYSSLPEMVEAVDELVTSKKTTLNRRRTTE